MDDGLTDAQIIYYQDLSRLRGQRGKLLELLIDGEWHPNYQLAEIGGLSFNDSIYAFRKEGWVIESRPVGRGVWEFRLIGRTDPPTGHKPMSRPQVVVAAHYMHVITETFGAAAANKITNALPDWMRAEPRAARDPLDQIALEDWDDV